MQPDDLARDDSAKEAINFCIKCFKGHLCLQYHNKKGFGLKCDTCHFRVGLLEGAARVLREEGPEAKCPECDSFMVTATYKPGDRTPFPGGLRNHTGCLLCDTVMRSTLVNYFAKRQPKKTFEEMTAEERQAYDEVRRKKEEKRRKREEEEAKGGERPKAPPGDKRKKAKKVANMLTQEEMMNEFIKKQFGA